MALYVRSRNLFGCLNFRSLNDRSSGYLPVVPDLKCCVGCLVACLVCEETVLETLACV